MSSRLAWKHGPIKFSSLKAEIAKILYKRKDGDQDSPLNVGPPGEVLFKLGEINWHFGRGEMKMDEGDEVIQLIIENRFDRGRRFKAGFT